MVSDDGDRRLAYFDDCRHVVWVENNPQTCRLTTLQIESDCSQNIYGTNLGGIDAPRHLLGAVDGAEPAHSVHSIGRER